MCGVDILDRIVMFKVNIQDMIVMLEVDNTKSDCYV